MRGVVLEQAVERAEQVVGVLAAGLVDLVDHHHRVGVLAVDQRLEHLLPGRAPFHWLDAPESTQPAVSELIEMKPMPVPGSRDRACAMRHCRRPAAPSSSKA